MKTRLQFLAPAAIVAALIALSSCGRDHAPGLIVDPQHRSVPWSDGVWTSQATLTVTGDANCWELAPAEADTFVVLNGEIVDGEPSEQGNWTDDQGNLTCPMVVNNNSFSVDCTSGAAIPGTSCIWNARITATGTVSGDHASGVMDIVSSHIGDCAGLGLMDCSIHAVVSSHRIGPVPAHEMVGAGVNDAVSGGLWRQANAAMRKASIQ